MHSKLGDEWCTTVDWFELHLAGLTQMQKVRSVKLEPVRQGEAQQ